MTPNRLGVRGDGGLGLGSATGGDLHAGACELSEGEENLGGAVVREDPAIDQGAGALGQRVVGVSPAQTCGNAGGPETGIQVGERLKAKHRPLI